MVRTKWQYGLGESPHRNPANGLNTTRVLSVSLTIHTWTGQRIISIWIQRIRLAWAQWIETGGNRIKQLLRAMQSDFLCSQKWHTNFLLQIPIIIYELYNSRFGNIDSDNSINKRRKKIYLNETNFINKHWILFRKRKWRSK